MYPNSYIIITGHLDHVGLDGDVVYNGADDNGSGTVSILEIAQAFQTAVKLVLLGKEQPSGYTEPILHKGRLDFKNGLK